MTHDSLSELTERVRQFAVARDWEQFHAPKNLAMGVSAEAGELAAEFQWLTGEESCAPDAERLARIRHEAADVLLYLVRLADRLDFDLVAAANAKIDLNGEKYPAEKVRGSATKYDLRT
ncbi:MAG: nucleotide pyrophosphohydrolase [Proteobacteria bacterium]|nr:nucleotide pyrophosphohydrolase [Burkholderiales bacterium]